MAETVYDVFSLSLVALQVINLFHPCVEFQKETSH